MLNDGEGRSTSGVRPTRVRCLAAATGVALLAIVATAGTLQRADSRSARVIVRAAHDSTDALDAAVARVSGHVVRHIGIVDAVVADVPDAAVSRLRGLPGILEVTPDLPVHLTAGGGDYDRGADVSSALSVTALTGARAYWSAGYTGQGVDIALIDSGTVSVDGLAGTKVLDGPDVSVESTIPALQHRDTFGHGTHMASLMAGRDREVMGPRASDTANYQGMAPDARVLSVKVADSHGIADVSQVLAGIDWVVQHAHDPGMNVRVMSLSFGTDSTQSYLIDPLAFAAETAWHRGVVVVASTGNSGWKAGLNNPADDPYLIAVGAADTHGTMSTLDDTVAAFSSTGDGSRNPDLVAPGVHLQGLRDPGSWIDRNNPQAVLASRFFRGSGTSQATALVAGAAALVVQQHPSMTPDEVKAFLTGTAVHLVGVPSSAQGAGELNLAAALTSPLQPASMTAQVWPPSTGAGTIEGSRGRVHVDFTGGITVSGEVDVHLSPVAAGPLALAESAMGAWSGVVFNGRIWPNSTAPPSGSQWSGSQWSGSQWSGSQWSGSQWSGSQWSGSQWSGSQWSGSQWSSAEWN